MALDTSNVQAVVAAFAETWNQHDITAFADLFADDAEFVNVVGLWWRGREEIRKAHEFTHAGMFRNSHLTILETHVRRPAPDLAIGRSLWQLEGHTGPDGATQPVRRGLLVLVVAREPDGRCHIVDAQNTDIVEGALTRPQAS